MAENFELFMRENKAVVENQLFPATTSLCGKDGKPLMWEFRRIPVEEAEQIKRDCTVNRPVPGKRGLTKPEFDGDRYTRKIVAASCVAPDLNNAALQDSYAVKTPEALLLSMVDNIGEWADLQGFVMELNGMGKGLADKVDEAKN